MLVAVGIFFIYEMFTVGDFGIAVNWNFFTSAWFWPIIYGCLIYYPLMCVFALLGLILPYALAVILLAILNQGSMSASTVRRWQDKVCDAMCR